MPGGARPGAGRKRGVPNKLTALAKDAIAQAAEQLGGVDRLVKWAQADKKHETVFWGQIYTKLLPIQVSGDGGGPLIIERVMFGQNPDSK